MRTKFACSLLFFAQLIVRSDVPVFMSSLLFFLLKFLGRTRRAIEMSLEPETPSRRLSRKRPHLQLFVTTKEEEGVEPKASTPPTFGGLLTSGHADDEAEGGTGADGKGSKAGRGRGKASDKKGRGRGRADLQVPAARAKVAATPPSPQGVLRKPAAASLADSIMQQQRSVRDEKRRVQMVFDRSLKPKASGAHDPMKCPPDMVPKNKQERAALWEAWTANARNYDKIKAVMKKKKSRHRGGKRSRVWVFESDVKDQVCNGNNKRAESMIKRLRARHGCHRIHPDISDEETGAQVHCLERDANDSANESSSEVEFSATATLEGTAAAQDEAMQAISAGMRVQLVTPKAKGQPKSKAGKGGIPAIEDGPVDEEGEKQAALKEAEKQKATEERVRKASEPIEKNKKFLRLLTPALTEADIVLKDLNSKKFKAVVPANMSADWIEMLSQGKATLLAMRTTAEKAAAYKDPKAMARKYKDNVEAHEEELEKFKTNIKACKSSVHVYLQHGLRADG